MMNFVFRIIVHSQFQFQFVLSVEFISIYEQAFIINMLDFDGKYGKLKLGIFQIVLNR